MGLMYQLLREKHSSVFGRLKMGDAPMLKEQGLHHHNVLIGGGIVLRF